MTRATTTAVLTLLALSLAGNFFSFGYVARHWNGDASSFGGRQEGRYSPEIRSAFRAIVDENRETVARVRAELRAAREAQEGLARQSPVDEAAMRAAMETVKIKTAAMQSLAQDYLLMAIKKVEAVP